MNKPFKIIGIILFLGCILTNCNSDDNNSSKNEAFDSQQMLSDVTSNIILPSIENFKSEAILLKQSIFDFTGDPTEEKLVVAQNQWEIAAKSYANIYTFNIGKPKELFMHQLIFNWPAFTPDIDNAIANDTELNIELISTRSKGLIGIEYLLFAENNMSNQEIVILFQSTIGRVTYLELIVNDVEQQALRLSKIWNDNGENYAQSFINNTDTGLQGSLNMLYNGLFNVVETIKKTKLGKPAGLEGSSTTNTQLLQAVRSEISLDLIKNNLKAIENTYFNTTGLGISDNVAFITKNSEINDRIKTQFENIYSALNQITIPLHKAIDEQKEPVEEAYNSIKQLVMLLNNEVGSTLSIIITPTDNDGD
ncbi:imelysin family protein [Aquimarina muelleri]|uniref:imelysin family protein n=1 Tax=Aquimarina muelleri TaxID=279356 RepID=UPI003F687035